MKDRDIKPNPPGYWRDKYISILRQAINEATVEQEILSKRFL